jgi:putative toxin-antitoxin system antitoxin component (TIGR02293 family)
MEKRRSSKKPDQSRSRSISKNPPAGFPASGDEYFSYKRVYEEASKEHSDYCVFPFPSEKPADLNAFNEGLQRGTKLQDPKGTVEAREALAAVEKITRKILLEVGGKPSTDIGGLADDMVKIEVAFQKLKAVDDRAARVLLLRVLEGKTEAEIASALEISKTSVRDSWRVAKRSISESLKKGKYSFRAKNVSSQESPSVRDNRLPSIIERATEVIGDRQEAMRWLGTPVRGLDYATPISLLATDAGTQRVNDILGQIEHGVW